MKTEINKQFGFGFWISTGYDNENSNVLYIHLIYPGFYITIPKIINRKPYAYDFVRMVDQQYGFFFDYEYLFIYYGIKPHVWINGDSKNSDHIKILQYPWNYGSCIRHSYFDINGNHIYNAKFTSRPEVRKELYSRLFDMEKVVKFQDYDGEEIEATISFEEMEWRRGSTQFLKKILRLFCKPLINRYISIDFNKGVGQSGVTGTSFEMRKNETLDECWERFLKQKLGEL